MRASTLAPQGRTLRDLAADCRALAQRFHNEEARERMLRIAAGFEATADTADQLEPGADSQRLTRPS